MTEKVSSDQLTQLRHSAAHLLAAAVLELRPGSKPTLGPATEDGFYYDFDLSEPLSVDDFPALEKKMRELVKGWTEFRHRALSADEARKIFKGNQYKLELIDEIAGRGEEITLYTAGPEDAGFTDLCRGGHVENPVQTLKHFKLLSVAGAYWRGDEKNPMLTRLYGTAFPSKMELEEHVRLLEEARKRDHRKLGKELDLFTFSPLVGPGLPLWTPRGTLLRELLDDFVWELRKSKGYRKVEIPHITRKELFEISGHWEKFSNELFRIKTREGHEFAMKPMNCPLHTQIFARTLHSYRDMPQRYANTTMCYRDEQTGELHGLSRVRAFTQDDAHVFCRESQFVDEALVIWDIIESFYAGTGFGELRIRLSLRNPATPEKYQGSEDTWTRSESQLREIIEKKQAPFTEALGEAAFYGPKIDFLSRDSLGREWQVATIQADRTMPEKFDLTCTNEEGVPERIVMIHAAIMGSIERFLSILLEHHAGALPLWLSPTQVAVLPISDDQIAYAETVSQKLLAAGVRAEINQRAESIGKKIRAAELQKVPAMLILGKKEAAAQTVSLRTREEDDAGQLAIDDVVAQLSQQIAARQ